MTEVPALTVRALRPDDWSTVEGLFGANGACGGCWCMVWRLAKGGAAWHRNRGEPNRKAFRRLVTSGKATGVLAFSGETAVGWCSVAPKEDFAYFGRTRALECDSPAGTWSVTCFFVPSRRRGQGVALRLLEGAIVLARERGASWVEGYPVRLPAGGGKAGATFAWTGVPALFKAAGFRAIRREKALRPIYRIALER